MIELLKKDVMAALKDRNILKKNVLQVVIGEIETQETRNKGITEEQEQKIIRKIIEANKETISHLPESDDRVSNLESEIAILESYLPKLWGIDEVNAYFATHGANVLEQILAANNDGQAIGITMKELKSKQAPVDGRLVKEWVQKVRA